MGQCAGLAGCDQGALVRLQGRSGAGQALGMGQPQTTQAATNPQANQLRPHLFQLPWMAIKAVRS
jgi:hypothetical protein